MSTNLSGVQADLPEKDVAAATAAYVFMRSYGGIFGVSIPAAVFNARFNQMAYTITDPAARAQLSNGRAYSSVTAAVLDSFSPETQTQVVTVFNDALHRVWLVSIAFACVGLVCTLLEKEIPLRTTLETEFGLDESKKAAAAIADVEAAKAATAADTAQSKSPSGDDHSQDRGTGEKA